MIHTLKGFGIVNKAEIDVFLELSCFLDDPVDVGNLISGPLPFLKPAGMEWGGRKEEGSGWGTHVYLWRIHFDIWQI